MSLLLKPATLSSFCGQQVQRQHKKYINRKVFSPCRASWQEVHTYGQLFLFHFISEVPQLIGFSLVLFGTWELAGVLVFSAVPFTAVKLIANSPLGDSLQRKMEERKKIEVQNSSKFKALSEMAREDRWSPISFWTIFS